MFVMTISSFLSLFVATQMTHLHIGLLELIYPVFCAKRPGALLTLDEKAYEPKLW
jgi:hypothetical protein